MAVISFTKVNLKNGWMGNMAAYPIKFNNEVWLTTEALFQALRFNDLEIRNLIKAEKSPMGAKMKAKSFKNNYSIQPCSDEDIENMRLCLRLKFSQHAELKKKLLLTGSHTIIEDVSSRKGGRHEFWGARKLESGEWRGENKMGKLLMELRDELRESENS